MEAGQATLTTTTTTLASSSSKVAQPKQDTKIAQLHAEVVQVSDILRQNVNKVLDRGQRLEDLEVQSGKLAAWEFA